MGMGVTYCVGDPHIGDFAFKSPPSITCPAMADGRPDDRELSLKLGQGDAGRP